MKNSKTIIRIALVCVACAMLIYIISLQFKINDLKKEYEELTAIKEAHQREIEALEHDLTLSKEEYIAKYAREVLGYYKYSDIIFEKETN